MAPGNSVGLLKVPYPIRATSFKKDDQTGLITEVHATYEKPVKGTAFKKPKTYIQWVSSSAKHGSPLKAEVRIFHPLFKSENPDAAEGGFMNDLSQQSEEIYPNAFIGTGLNEIRKRAPWPETEGEKGSKGATDLKSADDSKLKPEQTIGTNNVGFETVRFQALRLAYFSMDKDSTADKIVLNRIVSLKEDAGK